MNSNLHIDLIEFKAWYQHRMEFIDNLILVAMEDEHPSQEEIAQLKRSKIILIERSARRIVEIYSKYGFYPDL
ncbi:hypothetical protein ACTHQF_14300 [Pedobacter sp. SAFR-022]|uniref:hypothetical protein n=1 Tax=Pedobacter sp. SAFR-022 TaxID=3436861 RepID=UPI003F808F14